MSRLDVNSFVFSSAKYLIDFGNDYRREFEQSLEYRIMLYILNAIMLE